MALPDSKVRFSHADSKSRTRLPESQNRAGNISKSPNFIPGLEEAFPLPLQCIKAVTSKAFATALLILGIKAPRRKNILYQTWKR